MTKRMFLGVVCGTLCIGVIAVAVFAQTGQKPTAAPLVPALNPPAQANAKPQPQNPKPELLKPDTIHTTPPAAQQAVNVGPSVSEYEAEPTLSSIPYLTEIPVGDGGSPVMVFPADPTKSPAEQRQINYFPRHAVRKVSFDPLTGELHVELDSTLGVETRAQVVQTIRKMNGTTDSTIEPC